MYFRGCPCGGLESLRYYEERWKLSIVVRIRVLLVPVIVNIRIIEERR